MRRVNGIGPAIAGFHSEPLLPGFYYKQFVMTFLFVPFFVGFIYLVTDGEHGGWRFHGRIPASTFRRRFGWGAYIRLIISAVLESLLFLLVIGGVLVLIYFVFGFFRR